MEDVYRKIALMQLLSCSFDEIEPQGQDNAFSAEGGEYLVLTDGEADEAWDESLQNYLDECIFPELPENMRSYFDEEKWKDDAKDDGRGHSLSSYDGDEDEESVDGTEYYIFRIN